MPVSLDIVAGSVVREVVRPVARRPLQPHAKAVEGHHCFLHGGRVCGGSGGMRMALALGAPPFQLMNFNFFRAPYRRS